MVDLEPPSLRQRIAKYLLIEADDPEIDRCLVACNHLGVSDIKNRDDLSPIWRITFSYRHWQRIQPNKDVAPYLRSKSYSSNPAVSPCNCGLRAGIILPVDHAYWLVAFPPNSRDCRCSIEQVTEYEMRKYGWNVTPEEDVPSTDDLPHEYRHNFGILFHKG